jgi:hypothetical protein
MSWEKNIKNLWQQDFNYVFLISFAYYNFVVCKHY